jgi:hypothetical protein
MRSPALSTLLFGCAALALAGCPTEPLTPTDGGEPDDAIVELSIEPAGPFALVPGDTVELRARGELGDGSFVDVSDASWSTSDAAVASVIDGVVRAEASGDATIRAAAGVLSAEVSVTVSVPDPPTALSYESPVTLTAGVAMTPLSPTLSGGAPTSFSAFPSLPNGVRLDGTTGVISGTPLLALGAVTYEITARNESGSVTADLLLDVLCDINTAPDASADLPDDGYVDSNGDGLDGMGCGPVFVSPLGSDSNEGTRSRPLRSVGTAIARAAALSPPRDVYVAEGNYAGPLTLESGVNLIGGFDVNWSRGKDQRARIEGGTPAILATGLDAPVQLTHLVVVAGDASASSGHSVALWAEDNTATLRVARAELIAGRGADGDDGDPGANANEILDGGDAGGPGCENSDCGGAIPCVCSECDAPTRGPAGMSMETVAAGGLGGPPGLGAQAGTAGDIGGGGALGGGGGTEGVNEGRGGDGDPGAPGDAGDDGVGGTPGNDGADGSDGAWGEGGGGGGGGAGGYSGCNSYGGAGGGGGAGGPPGTAGTGGKAGGASVALLSHNAAVELSFATLRASAGGDGGDGAVGGDGQAGAAGGIGGVKEDDDGPGGDGGNGGAGGRGGHGGGGGGGHSAGVVTSDVDDVAAEEVSYTLGIAGAGGASPGDPGDRGLEADVLVDTLP